MGDHFDAPSSSSTMKGRVTLCIARAQEVLGLAVDQCCAHQERLAVAAGCDDMEDRVRPVGVHPRRRRLGILDIDDDLRH
uniref:Uncharacterized protein n=1 Tax=Arundo donax TaxID=35708 RepID=A0A0A9F6X1_ARUDO